MNNFYLRELSAGYNKKEILHDVSFEIPAGKITSITGSNACGKTTLLKCIANIIRPFSGGCFFDDIPLSVFKTKVLAEKISYCAQEHPDCSWLTVRELVSVGRYPCFENSENAVEDAMQLTGVADYSECKL